MTNRHERRLDWVKSLSQEELEKRLKDAKSLAETAKNKISFYKQELENRKREVPLGVPTSRRSKGLFCVSGVNTVLAVKENYSIIAELFDVLNLFPTKESAQKHSEMLLAWRITLITNAKGEPIDIKVLLPLLKKGWVAMDKNNGWHWYKEKPYIEKYYYSWNTGSPVSFIGGFNLKPAENWEDSLMECGL